MKHLVEVSQSELLLFKKKLAKMEKFKGRGTELISVYIPPSTDRSAVMSQLSEEISQSSNIKSPQTRKNVQGALRKIINFLKQIDFKISENGLVVFAGNISETEGRSDIRLFTIKPVKELKTKLYWCDSSFHLAPLKEMAAPQEVYGLVAIDKNEATIATLIGKRHEIVGKFTSGIAGKTRAGGQCLANDTLVQLSDGNLMKIQNTHNPLSVVGADLKNFTLNDSTIRNKWNSRKKTLQITTKFPRISIEASPEHVFFVFEDNFIKEKPAQKLKKNDRLLMPEKIKVKGKTQKLNTNFFNNYKIINRGINFLINKRRKLKLSQTKLGEISGLHQATVSSVERNLFKPRLDFLKNYCKGLQIDSEWFMKKYCLPKSKILLPRRLDCGLSQIIGYFLGDGCFEKERIGFAEQNNEVGLFYRKLCKKTFKANTHFRFRKSKNYYQLRVAGKPIVRFIKSNFFQTKNTKESLIPQKVLDSKNLVLAAFLKGFFDAEGYVTTRGMGLGIINKLLARQIQMALLRFSIIVSVHEYDSRRNPYSKNHRFTVDITEKKSLQNFQHLIGFTSSTKKTKLKKLISKIKGRSKVRQMLISGSFIRSQFEQERFNTQQFPKVTNFFRNQREMSKEVFKNSIIKEIKFNKKLAESFKKILERPLLPVKINKIVKLKKESKMTDIEVSGKNFIANGLLVHNSSKRFEHLREEAAQEFYKRISEKTNEVFLPFEKMLKGIIIGGPGITKNYFLEKDLIDYRLKKKIIGRLDTSYTDESGIREMIQMSEELLKNTAMMKERKLVNRFLEQLAKNSLAVFEEKSVLDAIGLGKAETVLLSEKLEWPVFKFKCTSCNHEFEKIVREKKYNPNKEKCPKCTAQKIEVIEEIDYLDYMLEKAQETGAHVEIISTETPEGEQFLKSFDGIGAILRYR